MFYENYVKLCNSIALSPNAVAKKLGFSSGTVTWWKKGRAPRDTAIQKIADYFGVSVNYLLGADEKPLTPSSTDQEMAEIWAELTEDQRREAYNYIQYLKTKRPPEGDPKG